MRKRHFEAILKVRTGTGSEASVLRRRPTRHTPASYDDREHERRRRLHATLVRIVLGSLWFTDHTETKTESHVARTVGVP